MTDEYPQVQVFVTPGEFVESRAYEMADAMHGPGYTFDLLRVDEPAGAGIVTAVSGKPLVESLRVTLRVRPTVVSGSLPQEPPTD